MFSQQTTKHKAIVMYLSAKAGYTKMKPNGNTFDEWMDLYVLVEVMEENFMLIFNTQIFRFQNFQRNKPFSVISNQWMEVEG